VRQAPAGAAQEDAVAGALQQHLGAHQTEQLLVADLLGPAASGRPIGRKERAGSAIECDKQGVEVGAHDGLLVSVAVSNADFDALETLPSLTTAAAVNYRSTI